MANSNRGSDASYDRNRGTLGVESESRHTKVTDIPQPAQEDSEDLALKYSGPSVDRIEQAVEAMLPLKGEILSLRTAIRNLRKKEQDTVKLVRNLADIPFVDEEALLKALKVSLKGVAVEINTYYHRYQELKHQILVERQVLESINAPESWPLTSDGAARAMVEVIEVLNMLLGANSKLETELKVLTCLTCDIKDWMAVFKEQIAGRGGN